MFSTAFIKLLNPNIEIERVFNIPEGTSVQDTLIYDIGCKDGYETFDHHQKDNEVRENGIPYASFGKLFRAYGKELGLEKESLETLEKMIVEPIDNTDNGCAKNPLSTSITAMNPNWDSKESADECFFRAVSLASTILESEIERGRSVEMYHSDYW